MDISVIHPVYFYNNEAIKTKNIGSPEVNCVVQQIKCTKENNISSRHMSYILQDFITNNVSQLSNTFMIKLLEDYIDKDEIAYIVDFNSDFDIKNYLFNYLIHIKLDTIDNDTLINFIRSNIVFILNQFIQFYCTYKLIYNEGVDLYKFLYKETYDNEAPQNTKNQDKYVFCISIMNNMLETLLPNINECCNSLGNTLVNLRYLYKGED